MVKTTKEFIDESKKIQKGKYDYSKVNYINSQTKVCIICPEHGEFWQTPNKHLMGRGCPKCAHNRKLTTEDFIKKSIEIYGDKYDYCKSEYVNADTKVCVICPEHGEFWQRPDHFYNGHGCPICGNKKGGEKNSLTTEEFIKRSKEVHGDKYDYSKAKYNKAKEKVCIICPEHGEFLQEAYSHMNGKKCPKCAHQSYRYTKDEFIEMAKNIHGDKYDYSKVEYINRNTPVRIICPEHGEFMQPPYSHLKGNGCPSCSESKLEREIKLLLDENEIKYEREKRFAWLRYKYPMPLDFYLPDYGIAIECQGEQHFNPRDFFKNYNFEERLEMDLLKKRLCNENGVNLLYYASKYVVPKYWDKYEVICGKTKLLEELNKDEK